MCVRQAYCSAYLPPTSYRLLPTYPTDPPAYPPTQAYCSALAVGYSEGSEEAWAPLARLVLEASFEAVQPLATLILPTTQPCVSLSVCMSTHYPPLHYSLLTAHYSRHDSRLTTHDALQASYEAVLLCAALDQAEGQGSGLAVLTFLGGGVFGNKAEWIEEAIARAVVRLHHLSLAILLN